MAMCRVNCDAVCMYLVDKSTFGWDVSYHMYLWCCAISECLDELCGFVHPITFARGFSARNTVPVHSVSEGEHSNSFKLHGFQTLCVRDGDPVR